MQKKVIQFTNTKVDYYLEGSFSWLKKIVTYDNAVIITDENVFDAHSRFFRNWNTIVLKAGEDYKVQSTVDSVIDQLIEMQADRQTTLIGVGGGVITDLTGYISTVYMRGIAFGFIPTTVLGMVDASIGGKNGIDVGAYKNMVGTIRQPMFILHDVNLLGSLPHNEWRNGFAEIIKHACIKDAIMFKELETNDLNVYIKKKSLMGALIRRNMMLKTRIVQRDEFEKDERKILNFGHTLGHALETQYELSHGEAISLGMAYAGSLSENLKGFKHRLRMVNLLNKYELPTEAMFNKDKVIRVLKMDKKKTRNNIDFVLLEKIGRAVRMQIPINQLYETL